MTDSSADIYHFLAEALTQHPGWLANAGKNWPLRDCAARLADVSPSAARAVQDFEKIPAEPGQARQARYRSLFLGENGPPKIWLYESVHRSGRLVGPETFEVDRLYRSEGLALQSGELQDHASIELAFLSFLAARYRDRSGHQPRRGGKEARFLKRHAADWLQAAGRQMDRSGDTVYGPIGRFLAGWLEEMTGPQKRGKASGRIPMVAAAQDCTFCGFCAQACPTQALRMFETEQQTVLLLQSDHCVDCDKCIKVCVPGCLVMASPAMPNASEPRPIMSSPRASCTSCGQPTVSEAELKYMRNLLGNPAWLATCLDCRDRRMEEVA